MQMLIHRLQQYDHQTALISNNRRLTYSELLGRIRAWEKQIREFKLPPQSPVSYYCSNDPDSIALLITLLSEKHIAIPLNQREGMSIPFSRIAHDRYLIEQQGDKLTLRQQNDRKRPKLYNLLKNMGAAGMVFFSSGSTGTPKAIVHNADRLLQKFTEPKTAYRTLMFLNPDHIGGFNTMFHTLANGGQLIIPAERSPNTICHNIETHQAELLPTTPSFLNLLLLSDLTRRYDLRSLKIITYGTEIMPITTLKKVKALFPEVKLKQTYGMSETGILPSHSLNSTSTHIKIAGLGYQTKVIEGVLWIKSATSMLGYLDSPNPFDADGWFCTRDLVESEGEYLRFLGRSSNLINVGGLKVYPAEVENILLQLPQIQNVLITRESNPILGQIVVALIKPADPTLSALDMKQAILNYCHNKLDPYKIPQKVILTDTSLINNRFKKKHQLND